MIALAGPLMNLLLCLFFSLLTGIAQIAGAQQVVSSLFIGGAGSGIFLIVNILPVPVAEPLRKIYKPVTNGPPLPIQNCFLWKTAPGILYASMSAGVVAQRGTTAVHASGYPGPVIKRPITEKPTGCYLGAHLQYVSASRSEDIAVLLSCLEISTVQNFNVLMGRILGSESITEDELEFFVKTAGAASTSSNTVPLPAEEH